MNDFIKFANENSVCYLATINDASPSVRALRLWFADQTGFYFQTSIGKEFYKHMQENPSIEVCFYSPDEGIGKMLRIAGEAEFLNDEALKEKVMQDRPFLKAFPLENVVIFRITHGTGHFWTMENNVKPKAIIKF